MFESFVKYVLDERQVIFAAPAIFITAFIVTALLIWIAMRWRYGETLEKQKELIEYYKKKIDIGSTGEAPNITTVPSVKQEPERVEYFSNIHLITDLPEIVLFSATASANADIVKIFLDYSFYYASLTSAGWTKKRRIALTKFDPLEKELNYQVSVVSKIMDTDGKSVLLKWGIGIADDLVSAEKYRARIVLVGSKGEQHFENSHNGVPSVTALDESDMQFREEWDRVS